MRRPLQHILCIDDEQDIADIVQICLEIGLDVQVTHRDSGISALADVESLQPDLILLDVMMPGLDGPHTFARLQALPVGHVIPVIFMTACVQQIDIEGYLQLGALGVITKPFDASTLAGDVQAHFNRLSSSDSASAKVLP